MSIQRDGGELDVENFGEFGHPHCGFQLPENLHDLLSRHDEDQWTAFDPDDDEQLGKDESNISDIEVTRAVDNSVASDNQVCYVA
jgi:hypothetical protein